VPTVVRSEEELVEANSKLGLISAWSGRRTAPGRACCRRRSVRSGTMLYAAAIFVFALLAATRMPATSSLHGGQIASSRRSSTAAGLVLASPRC
jgi:hypothetical protein